MLPSLIHTIMLTTLAMLSVSLWTTRVALTAQRRTLAATTTAAIEATVFAVAFSRLLDGLDNPLSIAAYALGVAAGTVVALKMDDALNPRLVKVDITDPAKLERLRDQLHVQGWPTTTSTAHGLTGPVTVISVTTDAAKLPALTNTVTETSSNAFWTVTPIQHARPTPVPVGFIQPADANRCWRLGSPPSGRGTSEPRSASVAERWPCWDRDAC